MSTTPTWTTNAVRKLQSSEERISELTHEHCRIMVERSHILDRMHAACAAINSRMAEPMLNGETFPQPQPCFCRYEYAARSTVFSMALEVSSAGPTLVFSLSKPKPLAGMMHRLFGHQVEGRCRIVDKLLINPARATDADVQLWFTYLLCSLHFSFKPGAKRTSLPE